MQGDFSESSQEMFPAIDEGGSSIEKTDSEDTIQTVVSQNPITSQIQALNFDPNQVRVISTSQTEWSDTCLEVDQPGVDCLAEKTQGYWIVMEANGLQFDYHSDRTGSDIQPATPGLYWTRNGGENGYCDTLKIYLPDTAYACWCQNGEMISASANLLDILSMEEYDRLIDLLRDFTENSVNHSAVDGSTTAEVSLKFYGQGEELPNADHQQSFMVIAEEIFSRMTP